MRCTVLRLSAVAFTALLAGSAAAADRNVRVEDVQLPSLAGGQAHLLPRGPAVHLLVFVKPQHPHCLEALQGLAAREGKPAGARWVAILPGDTSLAEGRALAAAAGVKMPFLVDLGDRLYGALAIKLHPTIAILDRDGRVAAIEPYRQIQFADRIAARIRFALGEITGAQLAELDDPGRTESRTEAGVARRHEKFASQLLGLNQLDQALSEVNKGLSMTPSAGAYGLQARILRRLGRCEDASKAQAAASRLGAGEVIAAQEPCPLPGARQP